MSKTEDHPEKKKGVVHDPKIVDEMVDCPKNGCGGSITTVKKTPKGTRKTSRGTCGRCGAQVHFYRRYKRIVKMTYCLNGNHNHS